MTASAQLKILPIRLPESELRRFKSLAASRGISVQQAVHQALEDWASRLPENLPQSLDTLEGSLSHVDVDLLRKEERRAELVRDQLSSQPALFSIPGQSWPG